MGREEKTMEETVRLAFAASLKACAKKKDLHQGTKIHADIRARGLLQSDVVLGNTVINMYAKCGATAKGQQVLDDEMSVHDVVSWSALISGYVQQGQGKEALLCYGRMQREGLLPNAITYACVLKACGITKELVRGKQIHDEIVTQGLLGRNVVLGTALIDMYAKCGAVTKAKQLLDELAVRNVVSYGALIAGYVNQGKGKEALDCYERLQNEGFTPNAIIYTCILKACGITQEIDIGKQIHDEIVSHGLLEEDVVLGNALIDMYSKCGAICTAQQVLEDEMSIRNVVSWSVLIAGYSQQGQGKEALLCFERMRKEGLSPDTITYASILKACGIIGDIDRGTHIHNEIVSRGLLGTNRMIGNALVDMYAKCGALPKAQEMFDEQPAHDLVSWNALIGGYVQWGKGNEALDCYKKMHSEHLSPDSITYSCILKACAVTRNLDRGRQIHDELVSKGHMGRSAVLGNALVDMYAKCGDVAKAAQVLDELPDRDVVSWNSLITGYAQQGRGQEALECYRRMRREGLSPDSIIYSCILKACGLLGELEKGKQIHNEIANQGLLDRDPVLGNALVDMYVKCGDVAKAAHVLEEEMPIRNVFSWSALIAGHAQQGQGEKALDCFSRMQREGLTPNVVCWNALIGGYAQQGLTTEALDCFRWMEHEGMSPDAVTFICVLNACSHSGLVDEGQMYFQNMKQKYGVTPDMEHHICMIDLFSRAGHLNKAISFVKKMPASDHPTLWSALLGACGKWGNVNLGKMAFDRAIQLDEGDAAPYALMANLNAAAGMHAVGQKSEP